MEEIRKKKSAETINSDEDLPLSVLRENIQQNKMQLKPVHKQSESDVWKYFGHLFKDNKIVNRFKDRIVCKVCFQTDYHIKRYVLRTLNFS